MKFNAVGEDAWVTEPESHFIAKTIQGGKPFFDAWRIETPHSRPLKGTPFSTLSAAKNACEVDAAEHPVKPPETTHADDHETTREAR